MTRIIERTARSLPASARTLAHAAAALALLAGLGLAGCAGPAAGYDAGLDYGDGGYAAYGGPDWGYADGGYVGGGYVGGWDHGYYHAWDGQHPYVASDHDFGDRPSGGHGFVAHDFHGVGAPAGRGFAAHGGFGGGGFGGHGGGGSFAGGHGGGGGHV